MKYFYVLMFSIGLILQDLPGFAAFRLAEDFYVETGASCKIDYVVTPASCNGQADGAIVLKVTGKAPFKYEWSNGEKGQNISELHAGVYSVLVTDATGCTSRATIEVKAGSIINITPEVVPSSSKSSLDGSIKINIEGGKAPYTYLISDLSDPSKVRNLKQADNTFKGLASGRYIINVVDSKGCMSSKSLIIKSSNSK